MINQQAPATPYRPTGLPLNSEVTIKVKHVANCIGESEWSASTAFTTGASRSLKDHYMARKLEAQVESIKDEGGSYHHHLNQRQGPVSRRPQASP